MLLCSSNEDHSKVEPLCPPAGVPLGELVTFEGHLPSPVDAGNRAGKAWKKASKTLIVDDSKVQYVDTILQSTCASTCINYSCLFVFFFCNVNRGGGGGRVGGGGGQARVYVAYPTLPFCLRTTA